MKDEFNRDIEYLKISLNNTCNLRCAYCMPYRCENDIEQTRNRFMSTEDYKFIIKSMADFGIKKIEFTGGEPLLNSDLAELIYYAKNTCNIEEVIVSTNGIKFFEEALKLKNAGLDKVNIGINSLKEYKYDSVTRGGNLGNVLKSFSTALKLNIDTTVEMLVMNNFNYDELNDFIQLVKNFPITLRLFELMYVGELRKIFDEGYLNIVDVIENMDGLEKIPSDDNICRYYFKPGNSRGKIGVISRFNNSNCWNCNKIILSYDGKIRLCTYENKEYDILNYLHKPLTFSEVMKEIITRKPKDFNEIKDNITNRELYEL